MRPPVKFVARGVHHSYIGAWFIAFSIFMYLMSVDNIDALIPLWQWMSGIGVYLIIDDVIEHNWTASTPCHILWEKIIRSHL